jgi:hypothetical protein
MQPACRELPEFRTCRDKACHADSTPVTDPRIPARLRPRIDRGRVTRLRLASMTRTGTPRVIAEHLGVAQLRHCPYHLIEWPPVVFMSEKRNRRPRRFASSYLPPNHAAAASSAAIFANSASIRRISRR